MKRIIAFIILAGLAAVQIDPAAACGKEISTQSRAEASSDPVMAVAAESEPGSGMTGEDPYAFSEEQSSISEEQSSIGVQPGVSGQPGVIDQRRTDPTSPRQHFLAARSAFDQRDFAASATHLRQGADLLNSNAARAEGDVADNLRGTAKDIDKLAEKVQKGELENFSDVNDKIAESYKNMADFHYQTARTTYDRNRQAGVPAGRDEETGNALYRASQNLEDWSMWTGRKVKSGARTTLDMTRDLAGKMISGTGWATEQAGEAINKFGETIKHWGRDVEEPGARGEPSGSPPSNVPASPGSRY